MEKQTVVDYSVFIYFLRLIYTKDLYKDLLNEKTIMIYCRMLNYHSETLDLVKFLLDETKNYVKVYKILIKLLNPNIHIDILRGSLYFLNTYNDILAEDCEYITNNLILLEFKKLSKVNSVLIAHDIIKYIKIFVQEEYYKLTYEYFAIFEIIDAELGNILVYESLSISDYERKTIQFNDISTAKSSIRKCIYDTLRIFPYIQIPKYALNLYYDTLTGHKKYLPDDLKEILINEYVYYYYYIV